jgi:hypothetical protein
MPWSDATITLQHDPELYKSKCALYLVERGIKFEVVSGLLAIGLVALKVVHRCKNMSTSSALSCIFPRHDITHK